MDVGSPRFFVRVAMSQLEWRAPQSGKDYLSFVNAALQKPLDINVSWLASVRPGLERSAVRVFIFVELS